MGMMFPNMHHIFCFLKVLIDLQTCLGYPNSIHLTGNSASYYKLSWHHSSALYISKCTVKIYNRNKEVIHKVKQYLLHWLDTMDKKEDICRGVIISYIQPH